MSHSMCIARSPMSHPLCESIWFNWWDDGTAPRRAPQVAKRPKLNHLNTNIAQAIYPPIIPFPRDYSGNLHLQFSIRPRFLLSHRSLQAPSCCPYTRVTSFLHLPQITLKGARKMLWQILDLIGLIEWGNMSRAIAITLRSNVENHPYIQHTAEPFDMAVMHPCTQFSRSLHASDLPMWLSCTCRHNVQ